MINSEFTIIIVNWNVKDLLKECLNSLVGQSRKVNFEIIVVDNNSDDGSVELIKQSFPQVRLIANQENCGYGKAINLASHIAAGDLLFILNPDTTVEDGTLPLVKLYMDNHQEVGVAGCFVYDTNGKLRDSFFKLPTLLTCFSKYFSLFRVLPKTRLTAPLHYAISISSGELPDTVSGSAMVVRKIAFEQVGGFDENYFLYYEETDLCMRIRQKGWQIGIIPGTKIIHLLQQSARKNYSVSVFHSFKSEFIFFRKFYSAYKLPVLRFLHVLGILFRTAYWSLSGLLNKKNLVAHAKLRGYLSALLADYSYKKTLLRLR